VTEQVTITPQAGFDAYDDPLPAGAPFQLSALVAPGDTSVQPGADGDLDTVGFTVYLPLRVKRPGGWVRTVTALTENFTITVRGQVCLGRVKEWDEGGRGGVEILATAATGATP
jgi:hypothetical protein